jgi:oligopeptide/dipeptide ABC transporter ATP-binding protein
MHQCRKKLMTTPLLQIQDLCKDFPAGGLWGERTRVVDHVDFAVAPGEVHGLVGESGCGKTTLARCSLGLVEPSSGDVFFDGINLASLSGAELRRKRREFQMIFQDPYASLNPAMSVEEIILEPLRIHQIGAREDQRRHLRALMDAVSLDESLMSRKPVELSGGQQQRVGIARGLALQPRLLVADEPVSALDVSVQAQILNLLSDLKRRYELTLILISHSLYVVHYLCTHVSVMYRGRIVEEAPSAGFFSKPKHPYSRVLLDSMPVFDSPGKNSTDIPELHAGPGRVSRSGCAFLPSCPRGSNICGERVPPLNEIAPGEKVACFLYR